MKKILLMVVAAIMAISASAQETVKKIRVYEGNVVVFERNYDVVDSVVFVDEIIPDMPSDGALKGEFSISERKKIHFSQGNLQYQASTNSWRFAENQYDMIGNDNSNISASYSGWIDLFGWGTGNNPTNSSSNFTDYGTFNDWGDNMDEGWYTLRIDQWYYIFRTRANAASLFGLGKVNGVKGTIILPDNWTLPSGATFNPSTENGLSWSGSQYDNNDEDNFTHNTYTAAQWAVMEAAGAVFLPAAGSRHSTSVSDVDSKGGYWSSTPTDRERSNFVLFTASSLDPDNFYSSRECGRSVRLVRWVNE